MRCGVLFVNGVRESRLCEFKTGMVCWAFVTAGTGVTRRMGALLCFRAKVVNLFIYDSDGDGGRECNVWCPSVPARELLAVLLVMFVGVSLGILQWLHV